MTAGINSTGFTKPTLQEINAEVAADLRSGINPNLDLEPDQPWGQLAAIMAQRESFVLELVETLANSLDPHAAEGFLADNVCAISGTFRESARKSKVTLSCNVGANFSASQGAMMANVAGLDTVRFINVAAVPDQGAAGVKLIDFEALDYGPTVANAGTLTVITAAVSGWNSCTNPKDAAVGALRENDATMLARRENEIAATGACTPEAIRADVLEVTGVKQVFVFENVALVTDSDGLPGKSFEVVVFDGNSPEALDADIATVIFKSKGSGVETVGTTTVLVTDVQGKKHPIKFSRAVVRDVYVDLPDVSVDAETFPETGAAQIKAAIVAAAIKYQNLAIDVVAKRIAAATFTVPGVLDVPTIRLGFSASPVATTNLVISGREIASLDTSRITVATVEGTP